MVCKLGGHATHQLRKTGGSPVPTPSSPSLPCWGPRSGQGPREVTTRRGLPRARKPGRRMAAVQRAARRDQHCAWAPAARSLNLLAVAVPAGSSQSAWSHVTASWLCGVGRSPAAPGGSARGAAPSCLCAPGGVSGTPQGERCHQHGYPAASTTQAWCLRSHGRAARCCLERHFHCHPEPETRACRGTEALLSSALSSLYYRGSKLPR